MTLTTTKFISYDLYYICSVVLYYICTAVTMMPIFIMTAPIDSDSDDDEDDDEDDDDDYGGSGTDASIIFTD